ncbi:hypothetical protein BMF94_4944 [Rhodotorula taiwanensis]|uniref:F-actin-capping protein subunit alpha n=1 Tax=Rhodotorula taiwanensis TaxID=741276 RepID=A0A2S5B5H0_9BASI|nr:hypothetical protein BMF94_4944 [Rhodotorula taiwanensis]
MSSSNQAKLDAACTFLLQSPPGELHDVLADLRAILSPSGLSDAEIETGLLPALQQFHETQFTPVQLAAADSNHKALVTPANKLQEGEFVEPRTGTVFSFDHVKETASPAPSTTSYTTPLDTETESARSALDKLLSTHIANHYTSGVSAVYVLPDPEFPPPPPTPTPQEPAVEPEQKKEEETAPATLTETEVKPSVSIEEEPGAAAEAAPKPEDSAAAGEPDSLARGVEGSAEAVAETAAEVAQVAEEVLEPEGVETANGESAVPADNDHETGTRLEAGEAAATEDDKMDVASPAPVVETAQEESAPAPAAPAPPKPRPSNQFGLYFVGSKYSPNNYWTGRWRSTYSLDQAKGTLQGTAQVNIHYYEQGNVQLSTTFKSTSDLGATPLPEAVVASIKSSESSFQRQLGETYGELSDATFRNLRRALPKTRSKLDWDRAAGYKLGRELGGGGSSGATTA